MSDSKSEQHIQTICLCVLTAIAIGVALYWLRPVIVPLILAGFFALILSPVINFLVRRLRLPRPIALAVAVLVVFAILALLGGVVAASVARFVSNADSYQKEFQELLDMAAETLPLHLVGIEEEQELNLTTLFPNDLIKGVVINLANTVLNLLSKGLLVMLFVLFLLIGQSLVTQPHAGVSGEVEQRVRRYLGVKVLVSAVTGFFVFVILEFLGVSFALTFGAFAFVLNFIPSIGSIIATLLPVPVVLLAPDATFTQVALAVALPGTVQFVIGNIVEPKMMGTSLDLHPVVVLLALMFWGMIWGFEGMLLAAPLTAVIRIMLARNEVTAPFGDALAGRLDALLGEEPSKT